MCCTSTFLEKVFCGNLFKMILWLMKYQKLHGIALQGTLCLEKFLGHLDISFSSSRSAIMLNPLKATLAFDVRVVLPQTG